MLRICVWTFAISLVLLCSSRPAMSASVDATSCKDGTYEAHVVSVSPEINDTTATMKLTRNGDEVSAKVNFQNGKSEEWVWNKITLQQKEFDRNMKLIQSYTAVADASATDGGTVYKIKCQDARKKRCDAGIYHRQYWVLKVNGDRLEYNAYGVSKDDRADATAQAQKRHALAFNRVNAR